MPRQVDHAGRRRLIAEAVCRLAEERGLEGVTLRDVAARAQVSMGAVQRCFRTKEEMLVFALRHVGERIAERVRARLLRSPAQSAGTALGHAAGEISLLRAEHRAEARVWLAFVAQAAVHERLAATLTAQYAPLQEAFTALIAEATGDAGVTGGDGGVTGGDAAGTRRAAASGGDARGDDSIRSEGDPRAGRGARRDANARGTRDAEPLDPRREARTLLALADGLTAQVLVGHLTPDQAHDVLDGHLRGLWERQAASAGGHRAWPRARPRA